MTWRSDAYKHFDISLRRDLNSDGTPHEILFVFTCKTNPEGHKPHFRPCKKTGEGTSNLQSGITQCFERRGENRPGSAVVGHAATVTYTEAAHRALIALRCAKNHRPFNFVLDEDYQAEVNMLRPGTKLPHPATVSRDIQAIYLDMSMHVRSYFQVSFCIDIIMRQTHDFILGTQQHNPSCHGWMDCAYCCILSWNSCCLV